MTAVAVLESTWVNIEVIKNRLAITTNGLIVPKILVNAVAASSTSPTFSRAIAIGSIPAINTMLFQSTAS